MTLSLVTNACGVKTAPTPLFQSKNELLDYAVVVDAEPTPTPSPAVSPQTKKGKKGE